MVFGKLNPFKNRRSSKLEPPKPELKSGLQPKSSEGVRPARSAASVASSIKSGTKELGHKLTHQQPPENLFIDREKVSVNRVPNLTTGGSNPLSPALSTSSIR